jgi:hypothetical protein
MFETDAMIPTEFRRRLRSHTIGRRRGLKLASAIAGAAWLAAPTISHAEIIDYVFSNASAVFNSIPETITGFAAVDPIVQSEYYAKIQLTGPAPYAGLYGFMSTNGSIPLGASNLIVGFGASTLSIHFANDLSSGSDLLARVTIDSVTNTAPTGQAVAVAAAITYDLSNVSTTVFNGTPEPITGFFIFDPLVPFIQYSGVFSTPLGPCNNDEGPSFPREVIAICSDSILRLFFANDLSFAADPLARVELDTSSGVFIDTAPTGEAVPVAGGPIPEPTTLALLGAALGLFLLGPRPIRRAGRPHPNQPEGA